MAYMVLVAVEVTTAVVVVLVITVDVRVVNETAVEGTVTMTTYDVSIGWHILSEAFQMGRRSRGLVNSIRNII